MLDGMCAESEMKNKNFNYIVKDKLASSTVMINLYKLHYISTKIK